METADMPRPGAHVHSKLTDRYGVVGLYGWTDHAGQWHCGTIFPVLWETGVWGNASLFEIELRRRPRSAKGKA